MKAWKIRVVCHDGNTPLSWFEALGRLLASLANLIILNLGWLGYLGYWQQSLTDRLSKTAIERV
jgi:uncharacterized RDD family membrane protein YckC